MRRVRTMIVAVVVLAAPAARASFDNVDYSKRCNVTLPTTVCVDEPFADPGAGTFHTRASIVADPVPDAAEASAAATMTRFETLAVPVAELHYRLRFHYDATAVRETLVDPTGVQPITGLADIFLAQSFSVLTLSAEQTECGENCFDFTGCCFLALSNPLFGMQKSGGDVTAELRVRNRAGGDIPAGPVRVDLVVWSYASTNQGGRMSSEATVRVEELERLT